MHEYQNAQFLAFGPERMELRVGKFLTGNTAGHAYPAKPQFLDRVSTCWAARSGNCNAAVAKATNRSGLAAQNSTNASFWF